MNATILHESRGRIRFRLRQKQMTLAQADLLEAWIQGKSWCRQVTVHERTCCVILYYDGTRQAVLNEIRHFSWQEAERTTALPAHSSRALNREFEEKLVTKVVCKAACTLFLPPPLRIARILWHMIPFVRRGLRCLLRRRIKVELLDALSISISACRRDFGTAGMVMFLLEVGELLEEWTRKKSVADLARCMSLNVDRVWLRTAQGEVLAPVSQIQPGDAVVVRAGGIIPVDGLVLEGEVTVNQASLTGESIPVPKRPGGAVYAGTVVEEGECVLEVKQASGQSRYDQIVHMIEQSEQMKSEAESKAANLADKLVPYTFAGSLISFALTRNVARALSVLMVDFSCALKLAMPLAVLSAMREAGREHITVKGGKFLEAVAKADTIVFDKTGTLTHACPRVARVIPFNGMEEAEMLRLAACLVEHFPQGELYVAVFQWAEGDCLFDHWNFERYAATGELSPGERFRRLPPAEKLAAFREVFAFLRHVEEQGYAPVDFYDGSLLYDFAARRLTICDIDLFRQRPLRNTLGADYPGTKRMKAPEEYQLGADITPATAVFTVGALLSSFFGRASQQELQRAYREERALPCRRETWQLSQGRYEALCKAMEPNPSRRFPTVGDFWRAWEGEVG